MFYVTTLFFGFTQFLFQINKEEIKSKSKKLLRKVQYYIL